ncbi:MAG: outer membrane beta-barrel protein [Bdellovibrionales bacterium]
MKFLFLFLVSVGAQAQETSGQVPKSSGGPGLVASGYVDVQMQWNRGAVDLNSAVEMPGETSGFAVYQGTMMLSDEFEKAELVIDIPFRQSTNIETSISGGVTVTSSTNAFELATRDAQAYVKYQFDQSWFWQFGQFDSAFGLEGNDSVDMMFAQFGILQPFTPNTHTGLQVGYSFLPFHMTVLVANGDSRGLQQDNQSAQAGIRFGWNQEPMQFSIGALYTKTEGQYRLNGGEMVDYDANILLNSTLSATFNRMDYGVELNVAKSRHGVAQTTSGREDHDLVWGAMAQISYAANDKTVMGMRYEYLKNDDTNQYVRYADAATNVAGPTATQTGQGGHLSKLTFGARRVINENLSAKAGLEFLNLNVGDDAPAEGKNQSWVQSSAGVVYNF